MTDIGGVNKHTSPHHLKQNEKTGQDKEGKEKVSDVLEIKPGKNSG